MTTNVYLVRSSIIAALGGLLFGFDTAVISGTIDTLEELFALSPAEKGFTTASALIGTIIGAIAVGRPADVWGRRAMMFVLAVLFLVSAIGCALAWDWYSLLAFRVLGGLGIGGASVVAPMYIAEISPAHMRGRLVALAQFNIVLGILLAFLSNYLVALAGLGDTQWRVMFGVEALPALAYLLLLVVAPRSPRWLVGVGQDDSARATLARLGTQEGEIDDQLETLRDAIRTEKHNLREPFFRGRYRVPITLAIVIAMFNQLSGINAVLYYAPTIFKSAGLGEQSALLNSVGIGLVNLVTTMAAIAVIDLIGRKKLMLVGSIGYILSLSAIAWAFYTQGSTTAEGEQTFSSLGSSTVLVGLVAFIAAHAFGQGAVIWVFLSEIFPTPVRARGQALGSLTHWVMAAAISQTFPMIAAQSGGHIFTFYALMMVLQLVWVVFWMPETRGVSLEKMHERLGIE
ncbi:MAG: sugar porter family MFS transporter [Phycisphaerales bacterium JB043]